MRKTVQLLAAMTLMAGCGGGSPTDFGQSSVARTETTATSEESSTAPQTTSAAGTTAATSEFALGETFNNPNGSMVTAFDVVRPAAPDAPAPSSPNTEWAAADVQVCIGTTVPPGATVSGQYWKLRDANNGQYDRSSLGYNQFPQPQYPIEQPVSGGECFRGWIVFPVVIGVALTAVVYAAPSIQPPFPTWAIPA